MSVLLASPRYLGARCLAFHEAPELGYFHLLGARRALVLTGGQHGTAPTSGVGRWEALPLAPSARDELRWRTWAAHSGCLELPCIRCFWLRSQSSPSRGRCPPELHLSGHPLTSSFQSNSNWSNKLNGEADGMSSFILGRLFSTRPRELCSLMGILVKSGWRALSTPSMLLVHEQRSLRGSELIHGSALWLAGEAALKEWIPTISP